MQRLESHNRISYTQNLRHSESDIKANLPNRIQPKVEESYYSKDEE